MPNLVICLTILRFTLFGSRDPLTIRLAIERVPAHLFEVSESAMERFCEVNFERTSQLNNQGLVIGVEGREGAPFRIYSYVRGGYCKVGRKRVFMSGESRLRSARSVEVRLTSAW